MKNSSLLQGSEKRCGEKRRRCRPTGSWTKRITVDVNTHGAFVARVIVRNGDRREGESGEVQRTAMTEIVHSNGES